MYKDSIEMHIGFQDFLLNILFIVLKHPKFVHVIKSKVKLTCSKGRSCSKWFITAEHIQSSTCIT